jgi:hypothetical protein
VTFIEALGDVLSKESTRIAIAGVLIAIVVGSLWARARRRRRSAGYGEEFTRCEDGAREALVNRLGLSKEQRNVPLPTWFAKGQQVVNAGNELSAAHQQKYHFRITRSIALLSAAAIVVILSGLLIPENTSDKTLKLVKQFVASFDIAAVFIAGLSFVAARLALHAWLRHRVVAELMRMRLHLMLPFNLAAASDVEVTHDLTNYGDRLRAQKPRLTQLLVEEIDALGNEAVATGWRAAPSSTIGNPWLLLYLLERPVCQFAYFNASQHRLMKGERKREWLILVLFVLSSIVALAKGLIVFDVEIAQGVIYFARTFTDKPTTILTVIFVVILMMAAYATSAALTRHDRNQLDAFTERIEAVERWLEHYASYFCAREEDAVPQGVVERGIRQFEALMLRDTVEFAARTERIMGWAPG